MRLRAGEGRFGEIVEAMKEPLVRLDGVDHEITNLKIDMKNKISIQDLYSQLRHKAPIEKVKQIEQSVIQLNEYVATLPGIFADRQDNDGAHKLLQKNLKNLYDLFVAMKSDMAGSEDPLFTTQTVKSCASCAKGVTNMSGYRADHVTWDAFPFKDPAQRMMKSGVGFNNIFNKSQ